MNANSQEGQPREVLTPEMVRQKNSLIWRKTYLEEHDYRKAVGEFGKLRVDAIDQGILDPEVIGEIYANESWSQYRADITDKVGDNASWRVAKVGLAWLVDPEKDHETRSRLYGVAGLCQAYLVKEQDEPAESLLQKSMEEAEHSAIPSRIGEAKNELALLYSARARQEPDIVMKRGFYEQAIPLFEDAARIHEDVGTTDQSAGHPYNNLAECYNGVEDFLKAVLAANTALLKYKDEKSPHSFTARFRKSLAFRGLGKQSGEKWFFDEALNIYEQHKTWRAEDLTLTEDQKQKLIANEDRNIASTRQEMQFLGLL